MVPHTAGAGRRMQPARRASETVLARSLAVFCALPRPTPRSHAKHHQHRSAAAAPTRAWARIRHAKRITGARHVILPKAFHHPRALRGRLSARSAMISRRRSAPTAAAMSIECTTSAKRTVTCLYSADRPTCVTGTPHSLQNLEFSRSSVPHEPHDSPALVSAPRASSTPISCHCWSTISVISRCHLRHELLRLSYVVFCETQP